MNGCKKCSEPENTIANICLLRTSRETVHLGDLYLEHSDLKPSECFGDSRFYFEGNFGYFRSFSLQIR